MATRILTLILTLILTIILTLLLALTLELFLEGSNALTLPLYPHVHCTYTCACVQIHLYEGV